MKKSIWEIAENERKRNIRLVCIQLWSTIDSKRLRRQISYTIRTETTGNSTRRQYSTYNRRNIWSYGKDIRYLFTRSGKRGQRNDDEGFKSLIRRTSIRRILQSRKSLANPELGQEQSLLPYVRSSHRTGLSYRQALPGMPSGILSAYISGSDSSHKERRQSSVSPCKGQYKGLVAGFLEAGETLEECIRREVMEETELKIKNLRYFGSQPWPYPSGIMIGFIADYESGTIKLQDEELSAGEFYSKDNMPEIPKKLSIARQMIDAWLEGKV